MNCSDIMKIPEFQDVIELKAGKAGMNRQVRWIYFADCLQCIQSEYKIENYIHGGEFVVLTNRNVTDDNEKVIALVEQMAGYHIVALGINEGQISEELMSYCDRIGLPLFELSEKYPLIDLSQIICQKLVMEETNKNAAEQLFTSILDAEHLNQESVFAQARFLDIDLSGAFRVVEFAYDNKKMSSSGKKSTEKEKKADKAGAGENLREEDPLSLGKSIKRIIQDQFHYELAKNILIQLQTGLVLALVPSDKLSEMGLRRILSGILTRVKKECGRELIIGVGNSTGYLEDVRLSRNEAAAAIRVADLEDSEDAIYFFKDQGLYTFISRVEDEKFLDEFVEEHLGRLIRADEVNDGGLCETLETFLNHNCSIKDTAEAMYLHRNTMNYRIAKIKEILGVDLNGLDTCLNLKLAFLVRNYRSMYHE
jgi:PucR family transcriptional regulator, proline-responsive transcriptional activator